MVETRVDELKGHLDILSDPSGVLASLLEHSPCPLALYNPAGYCVRVNPAYRELFGTIRARIASSPKTKCLDEAAFSSG